MALGTRTKEKIEKLLRQSADRSVTPAEAEAFRNKAFELMAREGLAESDVDPGAAESDIGRIEIPMRFTYGRDFGAAFGRVAEALHCSYSFGRERAGAVVFGRRRHLERLEFLWPLLHALSTTEMAAMRGPNAASTRRKRLSFLHAFMSSVADRLGEIDYAVAGERARGEAEGAEEPCGAELDFASDRRKADSARDLWLAENGYALVGRRSRALLDRDAVSAGIRAGRVVDIGNARVEGGPRRLSA